MSQDSFGLKALELACHYQNRFCEQEEIVELFCLDAQAAQVERNPMLDLSTVNRLAKVYCDSYASPHHITFTVEGLRNLIESAHGIRGEA